MKKTVVFDFDGVTHSYKSGWKGINVIPDPPVPGIKEVIDRLRENGYEVCIVSTRCAADKGIIAIKEWLEKYNIHVDKVCKEKPPALVYVDDRAICFNGDCSTLYEQIDSFKSWIEILKGD